MSERASPNEIRDWVEHDLKWTERVFGVRFSVPRHDLARQIVEQIDGVENYEAGGFLRWEDKSPVDNS